jgi:hypothetical protein
MEREESCEDPKNPPQPSLYLLWNSELVESSTTITALSKNTIIGIGPYLILQLSLSLTLSPLWFWGLNSGPCARQVFYYLSHTSSPNTFLFHISNIIGR